MFEEDFLECMVDEITVEAFTGFDEDGQPTFGPATTIQCRISPKQRQIQNVHGADVTSVASIYPAYAPTIDPLDRITLPNGEQPPILRVEVPPDTDGAHHTKVMI